ncbi:hypothetical protein HDU78_006791 [Chytriomyces hyalinus]|nr:hypothetical protein HDU78_006791 [Chytriomyces hyalinus]
MGIISFACKVGVLAYGINWIMQKHSNALTAGLVTSGRSTPVFDCTPSPKGEDKTPIIHATALDNGRIGLEVDLPGYSKENLTLSVSEADKMILLVGSQDGEKDRRFKIKIALPSSADIRDIHAEMHNGVLRIDIGKIAFEGSKILIE